MSLILFLYCFIHSPIHFWKKDFIYLLLERGERREEEERDSNVQEITSIGCLLHAPSWEPGPQSRHVLWLGINWIPFSSQAGIQSTEQHSQGYPPIHLKSRTFYCSWLCAENTKNIVSCHVRKVPGKKTKKEKLFWEKKGIGRKRNSVGNRKIFKLL